MGLTRVGQLVRCKRSKAGNGAVELAIAVPFLLAIVFGAGDFARIFYAATSVTNAAEAGALYGSRTVGKAQDTSGISTAVTNDTQDLSGVTVSSSMTCECSDQSSISCDGSVSCTTGKKRVYSNVTATYTFTPTPIGGIANIPVSTTINKTVVMRVE